ncbi:MAG: Recombinase [Bacteroidetes bacterium]|nr:Recombinase [Bacteroidota bacterium]
MNMKPSKYFLYVRKSSESEEKQVMSIEAQIVELEQDAKREGIKITERFVESKSAKTPGRIEFNKMIEKIYASKEPVGVIAWHPDRLARNSVDGGQIVYLIDIQKIAALRFPTFWFEPTPQGLFMLQVAFGQSKYYSDNLSENVKRGIRQKIRRGEWIGKAPLGYVNNPKTRNIEPDPVRSRIVQKLFEDFAKGKESIDSTCHRLFDFGITNGKGTVWYKSAVHWLLTNPIYTGVIKYKDEIFEGTFEPLISTELFEAVQSRLKQNSRPRKSKHKHDFVFTDLLKCGECGCSITAQYGKGNGGTYRYYRCTKKKVKCSQGYLREEIVLQQMQEQILKVAMPEEWSPVVFTQMTKWENEERKERQIIAQKIEFSLSETQMKLDKLVNGFVDGVIERAIYLQKKEELIKLKMSLELKQKTLAKNGNFWLEPMREFLELAHSAEKIAFSKDLPEIKSFIEQVGTNRIIKDKNVVLEFHEPFSLLLENKRLSEGVLKKEKGAKKEGDAALLATSPVVWELLGSNQ